MSEALERAKTQELVCIVCPIGCRLKAEVTADGAVRVAGNTCNKGVKYAVEELTNPTRTVTTSIPVDGGHMGLLSVKTARPVPKAAIPAILRHLRRISATSPVAVGDVLLPDAAGTGVDIVATRSIRRAAQR